MSARETATSTDRLLDGRVTLLQPLDGYRAAIDPVFLAASIDARPGQTVLELGCGTGAATLCLAARLEKIRINGIEIDEGYGELARRSVELSGFGDRVFVTQDDIRNVAPESADHVMANPPFGAAGAGTRARTPAKAHAHQEGSAVLADWIDAAFRAVRRKGSVTMIYNADRLDALVAGFRAANAGAISLYPLWPKQGRAARRVIVSARRGTREPARLLPGLVLHDSKGAFTVAADKVLRRGQALPATVQDDKGAVD